MRKTYKICILLTNTEAAANMTGTLLKYGIPSFVIAPTDGNLDLILPDETKFIIVDCDYADDAALKFLKKIKTRDPSFPYYIVGTAFTATNELITTLKQYNLISFLIKPLTSDTIKTKVEQILKKFEDHFPDRKHLRIKPEPDEMMKANFRYKGKFYSSKVIDISLGGVACEIYSQNENPELEENALIDELEINMQLKDIQIQAQVVLVKSRFISFKFIEFKHKSYEILSKYILTKISV